MNKVGGFTILVILAIFSLLYANNSKTKEQAMAKRIHSFYECVIVTMEEDSLTQTEAEESCRPSFYPDDAAEYSKY